MRSSLVIAAVAMLCGCPQPPPPPAEGFPCAVAEIVSTKCLQCHGDPLANSAPMSLRTRSDFAAVSMIDETKTVAQRAVARLETMSAPMPPVAWPVLTDDERGAFEAWVAEGIPSGTCETQLDAGEVDAGPVEPTCQSGVMLPAPSVTNPHGAAVMAPGEACASCHLGHNFENQNPGSQLERIDLIYDVMGTVFPALHEKDLCASEVGDGGTVVEIVDSTGALVIRAPVNSGGNFYASADGGLKLPFTARVVRGNQTLGMTTPQTVGDCNTCHTVLGEQGAPGRIISP